MSEPQRWLAIDTATDVASVAIRSANVTVERSCRGARQHAAQIVPLIHEVLGLAKLPFNDLLGVIVGDGPGSFTGVRIGWAAAKGLIHDRQLPLIAIPSLLGAAYGAGVETVAACYDALRGQVFGAIYRFGDDRVQTLVAPSVFTLPELVAAAPRPPILAVGDGADRYRDEVVAWTGRAPVGLNGLPGLAGSLLSLFSYDFARRGIDDPSVAEPVYGRPAEAQVKWESRYGRPLPNSSR
ncbi:MAG TPA: tRNA (adenosine(37)-N6)-threonylcarbamoyltransferase complex dimerization subunit type 1 TsaB [Gemmatimonadales bacterium]|nr:tRNA (adenosine(37)-N6)-threonylcarbamoyltransferase complex dimerization subunit type 1 TsaB [Gemmatimonadales bacterium]